ncbi:hypothetical protein QBC34DRAFT_377989 [Podospora aff. communis PSN243]|uniref:Uncharacterized protein n=1 Tax=Podospora aff. communis PSN243 TaxID=3040156 RepID=A0AAV9GRY3_9PEZI|nr:hypothetical protein QBC34DRAFT_377989 [Podospora aff. communis PSN243]
MPITTLTELRTKKEKSLPAFSGTGASGATIASGQLSNQLSKLEAPKLAQETQKLYVHGDSIKCNIVNGPVINNGDIRFVGKTKASTQPPKVLPNIGAETGAAVTVAGSMKLTMVCESLTTNGITFGEDDDEDL